MRQERLGSQSQFLALPLPGAKGLLDELEGDQLGLEMWVLYMMLGGLLHFILWGSLLGKEMN